MNKPHCWHSTGIGFGNNRGTYMQYVCCFCGQRVCETFEEIAQPQGDHGPHWQQPPLKKRILPDGECTERGGA